HRAEQLPKARHVERDRFLRQARGRLDALLDSLPPIRRPGGPNPPRSYPSGRLRAHRSRGRNQASRLLRLLQVAAATVSNQVPFVDLVPAHLGLKTRILADIAEFVH